MLQPKPKAVLADGTPLVIEYACKTMDTILFITDLHSGSRVRELVGTRDVCSQLGYHVEEIETSRLEASFEDVVRYWSPVGCILTMLLRRRPYHVVQWTPAESCHYLFNAESQSWKTEGARPLARRYINTERLARGRARGRRSRGCPCLRS